MWAFFALGVSHLFCRVNCVKDNIARGESARIVWRIPLWMCATFLLLICFSFFACVSVIVRVRDGCKFCCLCGRGDFAFGLLSACCDERFVFSFGFCGVCFFFRFPESGKGDSQSSSPFVGDVFSISAFSCNAFAGGKI